MACRDAQAVAALAPRRRRAAGGQARRHCAVDQGSGGPRPHGDRRRRAVAPAFRAWLPRAGGRHRLRSQGGDGHPRRPLQGDGAAGGGPPAPGRARACHRGPVLARKHEAPRQVHAARPDDDRRHGGRPPLRQPRAPRVRLRRTAERGGARARGRRRGHRAVRRARVQRLPRRGSRLGRARAGARRAGPGLHDGGAHLLRLRHSGQRGMEAHARRPVAPVRDHLPAARGQLHPPGVARVPALARAGRADGAARGQGRDGGRDRRGQRHGGVAAGGGRHDRRRGARSCRASGSSPAPTAAWRRCTATSRSPSSRRWCAARRSPSSASSDGRARAALHRFPAGRPAAARARLRGARRCRPGATPRHRAGPPRRLARVLGRPAARPLPARRRALSSPAPLVLRRAGRQGGARAAARALAAGGIQRAARRHRALVRSDGPGLGGTAAVAGAAGAAGRVRERIARRAGLVRRGTPVSHRHGRRHRPPHAGRRAPRRRGSRGRDPRVARKV